MDKSEEQLNRLSDTMRLYAEMRFKQLTVFLAWLTLAGAGVVNFQSREFVGPLSLGAVLALATMLVTAVVWVMEVRSTLYWVAIREEEGQLWPRPKKAFLSCLNATNMVVLLYCCNYGFWCWSGFKWGINVWTIGVFAFIGFVIFLFTIINYWSLWFYKESEPNQVKSSK